MDFDDDSNSQLGALVAAMVLESRQEVGDPVFGPHPQNLGASPCQSLASTGVCTEPNCAARHTICIFNWEKLCHSGENCCGVHFAPAVAAAWVAQRPMARRHFARKLRRHWNAEVETIMNSRRNQAGLVRSIFGFYTAETRSQQQLMAQLPFMAVTESDVDLLDTECSICLLDFDQGDITTTLPCSHPFHTACFDLYIRHSHSSPQTRKCPLCRAPLKKSLPQ
jgi:hypothetical protein